MSIQQRVRNIGASSTGRWIHIRPLHLIMSAPIIVNLTKLKKLSPTTIKSSAQHQ
jgi:hypothetical protein